MMADGKLSLLSVGEWNYPELEAIQPLGDACRAYLARGRGLTRSTLRAQTSPMRSGE